MLNIEEVQYVLYQYIDYILHGLVYGHKLIASGLSDTAVIN